MVETEESLQICTKGLVRAYNKRVFSPEGLKAQLKGSYACYSGVWHYGEEPHDLRGTACTLEKADGEIPPEHGILSKEGWSLLAEGGSVLLDEIGWSAQRTDKN